MSQAQRKADFELPTSIIGRLCFFAVCLLVLPLSATWLWALFAYVPLWPVGAGARAGEICLWIVALVFVFLFEYLFVGLVIFSSCGLIWSIARPRWAERALQVGSRKMVRAGRTLFVISLILVAIAVVGAIFFK
jgi:hypothetical protein